MTNGWWKADVTALVGYYAKVPAGCGQCAPVTMWEPWNEPNNTGWGDGSQYVSQVLAPFYHAVKSVLPGAASTVIGGSSLNVPIGWWQQLIAAGGLKDLDVASVHPYTGNNDSFEEDGIPAQVRQLQGMLGGKPLWFTEVGWWSDGDYNFLNQANVVARAMIWQKVLGIPVWNYFFDEGNWGNDGVSFSLIQASSADDYVKPAALATMATASEIAHRPYLSMPATGIPQTYEAIVRRHGRRRRPGRRGVVGRTGLTGSVEVTAPGGGSIPVTVTSEYGDATTVSATSGAAYSLPISDQVTYLTYPVGDTVTVGPTEDYGADLALWSAGATATASSGNASAAIAGLPVGYDQGWSSSSGDSDPDPDRHAARPAHHQPDRGRHPVGREHGHRRPELHRLGRRAVGLDHRGHRGRPVPDPRAATGLRSGGRHRGQDHRLRGRLRRLLRRGRPPVVVAQPGRTRLPPCPPGLRRLGPARPDRRLGPHARWSPATFPTAHDDDDHHDDHDDDVSVEHPADYHRIEPRQATPPRAAPTSGRRRLLADHQQWGRLHLRERPVLRTGDGSSPSTIPSSAWQHPGRQGLPDGGQRRRHLHLRGRRLLRLDRGPGPQPAHRGHGRHPRRPGLLAGGLRRRDLRLR